MKVTKLTLLESKKLYKKAKAAYYNEQPIMSDAEFDKLEDGIRKLAPSWSEFAKTGVPVANKKVEASLDHPMPSLNKVYPEAYPKFAQKNGGRHVRMITNKLDGCSLQLSYRKGKPVRLLTRGDGLLGGDISFFIPELVRLRRIPPRIKGDAVFRLEGVMKKTAFEAHWSREAKGKKGADNARNMVNGIFNRRDFHPALAQVDLVVLGVYGMPLWKGLDLAADYGFNTVSRALLKEALSADLMVNLLDIRRKASEYEMDGLVMSSPDFVLAPENADKPKLMMAFKVNDEGSAAQVTVKSIVWQQSRLGRWQPKITIQPTKMDGVMVTNATAHNPTWMKERGIGPGAKVKILRSGGVIPKIVGVVKKAEFVGPPGEYEVRGRHFYMTETSATSKMKAVHFFLVSLGVELLALKSLTKLYDVAGLKTAHDYLNLYKLALTNREKAVRTVVRADFGPVESRKKLDAMVAALSQTIPMKKLMIASGAFVNGGMGVRKLEQLEAAGLSMDELLALKSPDLQLRVLEIPGFSEKTADLLNSGVVEFRKWYKPVKGVLKVDGGLPVKGKKVKGGVLAGVKVSFTGYRNEDQERAIVQAGGEVIGFSAKTDFLLYSKTGKASTKVAKAGKKATTWDLFAAQYKLKAVAAKRASLF